MAMLQLVHERLVLYGDTVIRPEDHPVATVGGVKGALAH